MAIALEAVDMTLYLAICLLIGLLVAITYTFERLADALDVSILGVRPFKSVASAIRNVIVAGLNDGISALEHVARDLWHFSAVSINLLLDGIIDGFNALERTWKWLSGSGLTRAIGAITGPIAARAEQAWSYAGSLATTIGVEVKRLDARIDMLGAAIVSQFRREIRDAINGVEADITARVSTIESDIRRATADVLGQAEIAGAQGIDRLRQAEDAAIDAARAAEAATAAELRDLLDGLQPGDVAQLLAAVPAVMAAVRLLEAETGLGRAECRAKVKGICGTDPSRWLHFLEGLAFAFTWDGLEPFAEAVAEAVPTVVDAIEALVSPA